jgi:hypothetical protein
LTLSTRLTYLLTYLLTHLLARQAFTDLRVR